MGPQVVTKWVFTPFEFHSPFQLFPSDADVVEFDHSLIRHGCARRHDAN
mgnify:CR=1 FL=1